jgi:hypothetical protein
MLRTTILRRTYWRNVTRSDRTVQKQWSEIFFGLRIGSTYTEECLRQWKSSRQNKPLPVWENLSSIEKLSRWFAGQKRYFVRAVLCINHPQEIAVVSKRRVVMRPWNIYIEELGSNTKLCFVCSHSCFYNMSRAEIWLDSSMEKSSIHARDSQASFSLSSRLGES